MNIKTKITDQDIYEYMSQWKNDERFTDLNMILDSGDDELAAYYLVSNYGCIDSNQCYQEHKEVEQAIEKLNSQYSKKVNTHEKHIKRLDAVFNNSYTVRCNDCHLVQFLDESNMGLYHDQLKESCWDCDNKNILIERWDEK